MPHIAKTASFLVLLSAILTTGYAEKMVSAKIGLSWPRALLSTASPSGDAEVNYGTIVDRKLAFGVSGNFLWNVKADVQQVPTGGATHYKTVSEQKTFMFPVMAFFQLDPMPDLILHPVAHFQIGYNSMIYSYNATDSLGGVTPLSPYFYGLIMKAGVDALFSIGESSSLFLGMEYRWADMQTASKRDGLFDKRNMGGIGISAGFRVSM